MSARDAGYGEYEAGLADDEELDADEEFEDDDLEEDGVPDFADADAFFAAEVEHVQPATIRLYDTEYALPPRVPLSFNLLLARHQDDESLETFGKVLAPLFGAEALQFWLDEGIDDRQLGIVLAWSIANIKRPGILSFPAAARAFDEEQARKDAEGKAPQNRAERRAKPTAGSGARSSRTGGSSRRTSSASTSSGRPRSRAARPANS